MYGWQTSRDVLLVLPDTEEAFVPRQHYGSLCHRVLGFKPQHRLEWRSQDGQNKTEQPDHCASLGDSVAYSTRIRFSVHTGRLAFAMYFATVVWLTSIPSLSNSPWIRGAPQKGFAMLIWRIS